MGMDHIGLQFSEQTHENSQGVEVQPWINLPYQGRYANRADIIMKLVQHLGMHFAPVDQPYIVAAGRLQIAGDYGILVGAALDKARNNVNDLHVGAESPIYSVANAGRGRDAGLFHTAKTIRASFQTNCRR